MALTGVFACFGEIRRGEGPGGGWTDGHDMLCLTSHAAPVVVYSALTARQHIRVGFLRGWRNLLRRHGGYRVGGGRKVRRGARIEQSSFLCTILEVGTDICRSHKVSCRNMTGQDEWAKTL